MIIETCTLLSPSTILLNHIEAWTGKKITLDDYDDKLGPLHVRTSSSGRTVRSPAVTVADYTIGGAFAGLAGSFGRRAHFRNTLSKLHGSQKLFGVGPGMALGLAAGCMQAAAGYGMVMAETAQHHDQQSP
jgi:hypothetical protein